MRRRGDRGSYLTNTTGFPVSGPLSLLLIPPDARQYTADGGNRYRTGHLLTDPILKRQDSDYWHQNSKPEVLYKSDTDSLAQFDSIPDTAYRCGQSDGNQKEFDHNF